MFFPGDFVLASIRDQICFGFVVGYDDSSYHVVLTNGVVTCSLENAVRAGWRRDELGYTLVDFSSQNISRRESFVVFVACNSQSDVLTKTTSKSTNKSSLVEGVLACLEVSPSIDLQRVACTSTKLAHLFQLSWQQANNAPTQAQYIG